MKLQQTLIAAAVLGTVSFGSQAAVKYKITDLGVLHGGDFSYAYSISDTGHISGRSRGRLPTGPDTTATGPIEGVRFFSDGYVQGTGTLGGDRTEGRAINDAGNMAGFSSIKTADGSRVYQSFVHHYATSYMQNIGTLGDGKESRAYGINNNGKVVGWSNTQADGLDHKAYVYDMETETMSALSGPLLGGERSFAFDINDKDQIVGTATTANGSAFGFMYKDGVAQSVGSIDNSGFSEANAINENGQVTGFSLDADKNYSAYIWDETNGMQKIDGMGGDAKGHDINNKGMVVGEARDENGGRHAFVAMNGKTYDLYSLLSPADQELWKELREAFSINDKGEIVGRGRIWTDKANGRNASRAFKLTVVPVPGAIFFMAPALGLLGWMSKRRTQVTA